MAGTGLIAVQFIPLKDLNAAEDIRVMPVHDDDRPDSIKSDAH